MNTDLEFAENMKNAVERSQEIFIEGFTEVYNTADVQEILGDCLLTIPASMPEEIKGLVDEPASNHSVALKEAVSANVLARKSAMSVSCKQLDGLMDKLKLSYQERQKTLSVCIDASVAADEWVAVADKIKEIHGSLKAVCKEEQKDNLKFLGDILYDDYIIPVSRAIEQRSINRLDTFLHSVADYIDSVNLETEVLSLLQTVHGRYENDSRPVSGVIEACSLHIDKEDGYSAKKDYLAKVIEFAKTSATLASRFSDKIVELKELGFNANEALNRAEQYAEALDDFVDEDEFADYNDEISAYDSAETKYNTALLEKVSDSSSCWGLFYDAFQKAATAAMNDGATKFMFMHKFGEALGSKNTDPLLYAADKLGIGREVVAKFFDDGCPKYVKDAEGNALRPVNSYEAFGLEDPDASAAQPAKKSKGLFSFLLG